MHVVGGQTSCRAPAGPQRLGHEDGGSRARTSYVLVCLPSTSTGRQWCSPSLTSSSPRYFLRGVAPLHPAAASVGGTTVCPCFTFGRWACSHPLAT